MLTNEKYMGEVLLQKTYTVDFLTKKRMDNTGQVPQYCVSDSHPAIIAREMWEAVQLEMERRKTYVLEHGIQELEYATTNNIPLQVKSSAALAAIVLVEELGIQQMKDTEGLSGGVTVNIRSKVKRAVTVGILMTGFCIKLL